MAHLTPPYYIVSLKHTGKKDNYMTLWRPNNAGYCYAKDMAGLYHELQEGYHNSEHSLPIDLETAEKVFNLGRRNADMSWSEMIENSRENHQILGIKWVKGNLVKP